MSGKIVQGFYGILRKTFFTSRLFGVFPVTGLLNSKSKLSRCSWITPYTLYYVITQTSIVWCASVHLYDAITSTRQFKEYGGLVMQVIVCITLVYILRLTFNWRKMMNKIDELENLLPPFKNYNLVTKNINRIMLYVAIFGLVEYIIYLIFTICVLQFCFKKLNIEMTVENYFNIYFGWYLDKVTFNYFTAIWLEMTKVQVIFLFYYNDALVLAVTLYLIYRFRNFNRLMRLKIKKCNETTKWADIQAHYTRLTRLVKHVDDNFNPFVFLSFLTNLMFICKMIYDFIQRHKRFTANTNNPDCSIAASTEFISILYSSSTIIFRVSRALSVSILSSHLHSLSRKPLNALHTLPASAYNLEFQRFMDQVYYSKVCLSGLEYFYVTRGTILAVLSTIITYELVLLQLPVLY